MKLHLVGGFLGSGKTTAIVQAAKALTARGLRVGVVTNDQGRYLVDTAFVRLAGLPAVEVTGGCFCCNYADLDRSLDLLIETARPDVIFAESVGSCADLVATVVRPLLMLKRQPPDSFSVFADSRLLLRRLRGEALPFSDDVVYIFDKQIEEAPLVVVNKADLLSPADLQEALALFAVRWPDQTALPQTSLTPQGVAGWMARLEEPNPGPSLKGREDSPGPSLKGREPIPLPSGRGRGRFPAPAGAPGVSLKGRESRLSIQSLPSSPSLQGVAGGRSLDLDYARYGRGEAQLAWLDEEARFEGPFGAKAARRAVSAALEALRARGAAVGHLKFLVQAGEFEVKVSFPTLDEPGWEGLFPPEETPGPARLLVNARVEMPAGELRALFEQALRGAEERAVSSFHPAQPRPTHRM